MRGRGRGRGRGRARARLQACAVHAPEFIVKEKMQHAEVTPRRFAALSGLADVKMQNVCVCVCVCVCMRSDLCTDRCRLCNVSGCDLFAGRCVSRAGQGCRYDESKSICD